MLDILQELVRPVLNKNNGETGTDLAQDLHSGRVEKRLRLNQPMVNLTMAEYLAVCQNFGRTLPSDTPMAHAFVVSTENPKGGDKGAKGGHWQGGQEGRERRRPRRRQRQGRRQFDLVSECGDNHRKDR